MLSKTTKSKGTLMSAEPSTLITTIAPNPFARLRGKIKINRYLGPLSRNLHLLPFANNNDSQPPPGCCELGYITYGNCVKLGLVIFQRKCLLKGCLETDSCRLILGHISLLKTKNCSSYWRWKCGAWLRFVLETLRWDWLGLDCIWVALSWTMLVCIEYHTDCLVLYLMTWDLCR